MSEHTRITGQQPLPVEIYQLIFEKLVEGPDGMPVMDLARNAPEFAAKYPTLLALCLVNQRMRAVVRPFLFRYVFIHRNVDLFSVLTSLLVDDGLRRAVRHITFFDSDQPPNAAWSRQPPNATWYRQNLPRLPSPNYATPSPSLGLRTAARLQQECELWRQQALPAAAGDMDRAYGLFELGLFAVLCHAPNLTTFDLGHPQQGPPREDLWRWMADPAHEGDICPKLEIIRLQHPGIQQVAQPLAALYAHPPRQHIKLMLQEDGEMSWVTVGDAPQSLRALPRWAHEITVVNPLPRSLRFTHVPGAAGTSVVPLRSLVVRDGHTSTTHSPFYCGNRGRAWNWNMLVAAVAPSLERLELDICINGDTARYLFGPTKHLQALPMLSHLRVLTITLQLLFANELALDDYLDPGNPAVQIQNLVPTSVEELTLVEWWPICRDPILFRDEIRAHKYQRRSRDLLNLLLQCRQQGHFLHLRKLKMVGHLCKMVTPELGEPTAVESNVDYYREQFAEQGIEFLFEESRLGLEDR